MRVRATMLTAAILLTALTACGSSNDGSDSATRKSAAQDTPTSPMKPAQPEKGLAFGKSAQTTGDEGTGVLEITPDTVVFTKTASGETAANGAFVVVTMKDKAMTAVAADEPAPISGGGWKWMAPDGEMIAYDTGNSSNVTMDKYNNADRLLPVALPGLRPNTRTGQRGHAHLHRRRGESLPVGDALRGHRPEHRRDQEAAPVARERPDPAEAGAGRRHSAAV